MLKTKIAKLKNYFLLNSICLDHIHIYDRIIFFCSSGFMIVSEYFLLRADLLSLKYLELTNSFDFFEFGDGVDDAKFWNIINTLPDQVISLISEIGCSCQELKFIDVHPKIYNIFEKVKTLDFNLNQITDIGLKNLKKFQLNDCVFLDGNNITEKGILALIESTNIKKIAIPTHLNFKEVKAKAQKIKPEIIFI